jgi:hypothetical protein
MTRARDVADTQDNLGGAVPPYVAGKNGVINGGFDIWQRGTSSTTNLVYLADRWFNYTSAGTTTFSQESTTIPTGARYALKITQASANATITVNQAIETANALQFAGQTVTISSQIAASASTGIQLVLYYSTTVDNAALGTWTQITASSGGAVTANSSFQNLMGTFVVPSTAKSLYVSLFIPTLTTGTSAYWGKVQLELGAAATPFARAGGSIGGELALCQRYYWREYGGSNAPTIPVSYTANSATIGGNNPVTMRIAPSVTADYQNANYGSTWGFSQPTRTSCTKTGSVSNNYFATPNTWSICFDGGTFSPTPTAFQGSSSSWIQASAEL